MGVGACSQRPPPEGTEPWGLTVLVLRILKYQENSILYTENSKMHTLVGKDFGIFLIRVRLQPSCPVHLTEHVILRS